MKYICIDTQLRLENKIMTKLEIEIDIEIQIEKEEEIEIEIDTVL